MTSSALPLSPGSDETPEQAAIPASVPDRPELALADHAPCFWPGATIVIIGAGPSITQDDLAYVHARAANAPGQIITIAINEMYKQAPWAEVLYAADEKWWRWQHNDGVLSDAFPPLCYSIRLHTGVKLIYPRVRELCRSGAAGLDDDRRCLRTGGISGYSAINLAWHFAGIGCRVLLLGYDMMMSADGRHHCHPEHRDGNTIYYAHRVKAFDALVEPLRQRLVSVINCSRRTAITAFPRAELRDVL